MKSKASVLWIEDETRNEMQEFLAPLFVSGRFRPSVATNASEATEALKEKAFDAVIVDIRIPPGDDPRWIDIYNSRNFYPGAASLGLFLLRSLFSESRPQAEGVPFFQWKERERPSWITREHLGLFSVEGGDVLQEMEIIGIPRRHIVEKRVDISRLAVVDLVSTILQTRGVAIWEIGK